MHRRPTAVIFDLDGTLVDSRGDIAAACNHALTDAGRAPLPVDVVRTFVGDGARTLLARAFGLPREDRVVDRALDAFQSYYHAHPIEFTTLRPGALDALDALEGRAVLVATNKSKETALAVLGALGLSRRFARVFGGGDGPLKPDPFCVEHVLGPLGIPASEAWFVGDGWQDVHAGRAAGCTTVGVAGYVDAARLRAAEPDLLLGSMTELVPLLG